MEHRRQTPIHPVQYALVGIVLILFYTLLLAFSEHIGFGFAYLIAAVMTVGMRIERKEAPTIFRPFWQAFKDNFRQGTMLTLLFMLVVGFLAADWYILM